MHEVSAVTEGKSRDLLAACPHSPSLNITSCREVINTTSRNWIHGPIITCTRIFKDVTAVVLMSHKYSSKDPWHREEWFSFSGRKPEQPGERDRGNSFFPVTLPSSKLHWELSHGSSLQILCTLESLITCFPGLLPWQAWRLPVSHGGLCWGKLPGELSLCDYILVWA